MDASISHLMDVWFILFLVIFIFLWKEMSFFLAQTVFAAICGVLSGYALFVSVPLIGHNERLVLQF